MRVCSCSNPECAKNGCIQERTSKVEYQELQIRKLDAPVEPALPGLRGLVTSPRASNLGFSNALVLLKRGEKVARACWVGMHLSLQAAREVDGQAQMPFIGLTTPAKKVVPWVASHTDMLSEDWTVVA